MNKNAIIVIFALLVATLWRAPGIAIDPRGFIYPPDIRENYENAFMWSVQFVFAIYLIFKINVWIGLFFALSSISAFFPVNTALSDKAHLFVTYGAAWYAFCVKSLNSEKATRWMLNTICIIALVNCSLLIMQGIFQFDPLHRTIKPVWGASYDSVPNVGLMSCTNGASVMLAVCMPAFFRKKWFWFIPVVVLGLILTTTFIGPLAVASALIGYGFIKLKNRSHKVMVVILCVLSLWSYARMVDRPDTAWRLRTWKTAMSIYPKYYLVSPNGAEKELNWKLGSGIGHWKLIFRSPDLVLSNVSNINEFMAQAHNELAQGLFEMGAAFPFIVSGYLFTVFLIYFFKKEKEKYLSISAMALIIIFITANAFFTFHIPLIAMVSLTWMAIFQNASKLQRLSAC